MKHEDLYKAHANQLRIHEDTHRYRTVAAGRRFGKSALGLNEALVNMLGKKKQLCWIILPTYRQAKEIYWIDPDIIKYFMPYVQMGRFKKTDNPPALYDIVNQSWVRLKGADQPDSLRGSGLDLIIWDEVADVKGLAFSIIEPSLADSPNHRVLYIGTPKGYNHFHDFALMGDHNNIIPKGGKDIQLDDDWMTWNFSSYDNLAWPEGSETRTQFVKYIDKQRGSKTPEWFDQEYLAKFTKYTGLVYKEFEREYNIIDPFDIPEGGQFFRCMDFGSTNPTVCLWVWIDKDENWYIIDEHYEAEKSIEYHAGRINSREHKPISETYGDPSGAQWISEFSDRGIYITPATREAKTKEGEWIRLRIEKIRERLKRTPGHYIPWLAEKTGEKYGKDGIFSMPSLYITSNCTNTIREFESYRWKERRAIQSQDLNQPDIPEKANDHAMDALGYLAISWQKPEPNPIVDGSNTRTIDLTERRNIIPGDGGGMADLF